MRTDRYAMVAREITGIAKVGRMTKRLIHRLKPGELAVIDHENLDIVSAEMLTACRVRAVLNSSPFSTGAYPNLGPEHLYRHGIPMFEIDEQARNSIEDGQRISIREGILDTGFKKLRASQLHSSDLSQSLQHGRVGLHSRFSSFLDNTLDYAVREKEQFIVPLEIASLNIQLHNRAVLVVVRGPGYMRDLNMLRPYIRSARPVMVGVDGGADALLECGLTPSIILGDMDSVSDRALTCGAEIIVHAYMNGKAPGESRLQQLGVEGKRIAACGTSEDAALQLAYEMGAERIVLVGGHSGMLDFLDKGREGMSSTLLTRMKVGDRLIDARGFAELAAHGKTGPLQKLYRWIGRRR
jgi:uncharacterized membrane-anchored protein